MKKILFFMLIALLSIDTYAQELAADDFVIITQENAAYPGFNARTYRGLFPVGHGQFKMFNYGGVPGNISALGGNETLGSFVFNGYDGSQNVISAVIQAKTITDSRDPRFNFLLSNGVGNQRPNRMTIIGQSGHVGIGVTDPTERLDVNGSIRMRAGAATGYIPVADSTGVMTWTNPAAIFSPSPWMENGGDVHRETGNVGIGTSTPNDDLTISRTSESSTIGIAATDNHRAGIIMQTNSTANDDFRIQKYGSGETASWNHGLPLANLSEVVTGANGGPLYMGTVGFNPVYIAAGNDIGFYMADDQDIGINNESPDAQLHVEGDDDNDDYIIRAESNYVANSDLRAVYGSAVSNPGYGYGGEFEGGYRGVHGHANSSTYIGATRGVYGLASGTAGSRYGVYGQGNGGTGTTANFGVYGNASGNGAITNYGIYGIASGADINWAGYFNGNTYVDDTLMVNQEIHINSDGTRTDRLVVMDESSGDAVYIKNVGVSSSTNVGGYGIEVDAGFRGIDVDMNDDDKNGNHYGYFISNLTSTSTELTGSQYGMYTYVSGARTAGNANFSIYAQQAGTQGSGDRWAGYFSGDVRITGTLDNTSDARLKKDVEDMEDALEIIQQLQPKTYQFKADEYPHMALDQRPQIGFIAQDVEKVLPQLVRTAIHPEFINDEGEESDIPNSPAVDVKSINYIGIIPVLTQGIKEMSTQITERDEAIEELTNKVASLEDKLNKIENLDLLLSQIDAVQEKLDKLEALDSRIYNVETDLQSCCLNSNAEEKEGAMTTIELNGNEDQAALQQNAPNPFSEQTRINYYIPSSASKGSMVITDARGTILKTVNFTETGFGTVFIKAGELAPGTYAYTLFVDGSKVATKQMVLIR